MNSQTSPQVSSLSPASSSVSQNPPPFPHWFLQQKDWVQDPLGSDSAIYNYPLAFRVRGPLNLDALRKTFSEIITRHETLRSVFTAGKNRIFQHVQSFDSFTLPLIDLSHLKEMEAVQEARRLATQDALSPFDFSRVPGFRVMLIRIAAHDHLLAMTAHHLIFDDWSVGLITRELIALYSAFAEAKPSPLPEMPFQYRDFARIHAETMGGRNLESHLTFWKDQLKDAGDFHHLTPDRPRPSIRTNNGGKEAIALSPQLTAAIKTTSQREGASLFMVLVAAFQSLLHRLSGDTDIAVGSCVAGRNMMEVEGVIGHFGNDVVLRTSLADNPTFRDLLKRVRRTSLLAYSHQEVPFGSLVEQLLSLPDPAKNPLFQVMFILQDAPKDELKIPGLELDWFPIDPRTAKYDLNVWIKVKKGIEIAFEYNADLFDPETMRQILASFRAILERVVAEPEVRVANLPLASEQVEPVEIRPSAASTEYVPPRNSTEARLVELWQEVLQRHPIGVRQSFFELGGSSLLAAQICIRIEKSLGKRVSLAAFLQAPTIEELASSLNSTTVSDQMVQVVPLQPRGSATPLFCPCVNVGAGPGFLPLAHYLGDDQPFLGLVPDENLGSLLPLPYSMEEIAKHLIVAIRRRQPQGPYYLGGFCGDGVLAFETARQLRAQGESVPLLVLFEVQTPDRYPDFRGKFFQLRAMIGRLGLRRLGRHLNNLRQASEPEKKRGYVASRLQEMINDLKNLWWQTTIDWNRRLHRGRLRDFRQVLFMAEKFYRPRLYDGDVAAFRCTQYRATPYQDRHGGWRDFVTGSLEVYEIPGDHMGILDEPNVQLLAEKLANCLRLAYRNSRNAKSSKASSESAPPDAVATVSK
jgi:thioesterase domain-containing protein/acyl carrier protein